MLWRLIRSGLAPHRRALSVIVVLQLVSTIASLYLPNLTADIIDHGVAKGDTGYIMAVGAVMLAISVVPVSYTHLVGAVMLFGIPARRDAEGGCATDPAGILARAVRASVAAAPGLPVIADLCLDEFTDHGHCGVVDETGRVENCLLYTSRCV